MFKKVTGDKLTEEQVRELMRFEKQNFVNLMSHVKQKKEEYRLTKRENDKMREQLAKDEQNASQFKFTKMTRKPPYKPLVHNEGIFQKDREIIPEQGPHLDYTNKIALIFPKKVKDNSSKWHLLTNNFEFFKKETGREQDQFDELKEKYFKSTRRGLGTVTSFLSQTRRAFTQVGSVRSNSNNMTHNSNNLAYNTQQNMNSTNNKTSLPIVGSINGTINDQYINKQQEAMMSIQSNQDQAEKQTQNTKGLFRLRTTHTRYNPPMKTFEQLGMPEKIWNPVFTKMEFLQNTKPLLDNTHTPRSRTKAISLDRNFSNKRWIPPKHGLDEFKIKEKKKYGGQKQ